MKVAIVVPAAGSPGTLATTAFVGALAEGLSRVGVQTRVIGLTLSHDEWVPSALGPIEAVAPWLPPLRYRFGDRAEASRRGIFDETVCQGDRCEPRWRLELLLERALVDFAPEGSDNVVLADTRSAMLLRIVCRVAHRLGWRVVVISNEALSDAQIDPATRDDYIRCVTRCAGGVWAFSDYLREYWHERGVANERLFVNPPVVRPSSFVRTSAPSADNDAVYIGNLAHREVDHLVDIAAVVAPRVPGFTLTMYGDAPADVRASLESRLSARGLDRVVRVMPPVSPVEVPAVLEKAAVLLLPRSRGEFSTAGFPNKLGEYLASGRPVVVTKVGDIPDYLEDGRDAFLVEPDDIAAFSDAVAGALTDSATATAVGAEGARTAARLMCADTVAERLTAFMRALPPAPACPPRGRRSPLAALTAPPDLDHIKVGLGYLRRKLRRRLERDT